MIIKPLNNSWLAEQGWKDIYLKESSNPLASESIHIFHYYTSKSAKNILFLHTPVIAVKNCFECYEQLGRLHGFNIFALDYVPGEGECSGTSKDFTLDTMVANIDIAYDYIVNKFSSEIHLLGYTGVGGVMAQYYIGTGREFKSFSQFACANYKDTKPFGIPSLMVKQALWLCNLITTINPNASITYKPPKATGFHADLDNAFYNSITSREPTFFALKLMSLRRTLECVVGKHSYLKQPIACPTLVFKTLHDRFFPTEYFDRYYNSLTCEKKLVEINDIHNSYFITPKPFITEIAAWVDAH